MTTFDLAEVRNFAANLDARMDLCDNGEGMECANIDATLRHYANLCCEFRKGVRQWGRSVFSGQVAFDPEVEKVLQDEGHRLLTRAAEMLAYGQQAEVPCYALGGQAALQSTLLGLYMLLDKWVSPKLAVGPSARQGLDLEPAAAEAAKLKIGSLPPQPADWAPDDPRQQHMYRKLCRN